MSPVDVTEQTRRFAEPFRWPRHGNDAHSVLRSSSILHNLIEVRVEADVQGKRQEYGGCGSYAKAQSLVYRVRKQNVTSSETIVKNNPIFE